MPGLHHGGAGSGRKWTERHTGYVTVSQRLYCVGPSAGGGRVDSAFVAITEQRLRLGRPHRV